MKTAKYYRLHNNYGGQKGGGGRWKATKAKLKNWGSDASSFVGKQFQTQSYQAKQKAIDAMGKNSIGPLKERDYRFMSEILTKKNMSPPKSNRSRQRDSEKLINIIAKMSPVNKLKTGEVLKKELSLKTRAELIQELKNLKNAKSSAYAQTFIANVNTTKKALTKAKTDFITKQTEYQTTLDAKEKAIRALKDAKTSGQKKHNPEYYETLKKALTDAEDQVKEFKKKDLQTLQADFLKEKAAYNKLVGEEGTIGSLEQTAKEKTVAKRVYKVAKNTVKGIGTGIKTIAYTIPKTIVYTIPKTVAKAVWSPIKTYRALTEKPKDYVNKLSTGNKNTKTEYINKLKEHMNDPVKRAKVNQYISALDALKLNLENLTVKDKNWSAINAELQNIDDFKNLSRDNQTIVKNGLRAKFMKYRYEKMQNTVSKALERQSTTQIQNNNNSPPQYTP